MREPVIAGIDLSPRAGGVAAYAAQLARRRGSALALVHVLTPGHQGKADTRLEATAVQRLGQVAAETRSAHPALTTTTQVRTGSPAAVLVELSRHAEVTVLGAHHGEDPLSLVTCVPAQVAAHGHGNTVVVHPGGQPTGPVLVGIGTSAPACAALQYAAEEATSLEVALVVIHVYWNEPEDSQRLRADVLEALRAKAARPEVVIRPICSPSPEYVMVDESEHGAVTVVGTRGGGVVGGLLLGSVSQTLVRQAAGPVAVIHAPG